MLYVIFFYQRKELLKKEDNDDVDKKNISIFKEIKQMLTFKPYLILCGSAMLGILSIQVKKNLINIYRPDHCYK